MIMPKLMTKFMMKLKTMGYIFSFVVKRVAILYDTEGAGLVVEPRWGGAALEASPHSIQVLLGVENELLKPVCAGHVTRRLEVFPGLGTHLSRHTWEQLGCKCADIISIIVITITVSLLLLLLLFIIILLFLHVTQQTIHTVQYYY